MAIEKGFYEEAGLSVTLKEYQAGDDVVQDVIKGESEYGLGYPSIILNKIQHKNIVLLHAIYQSSPHVLVTLDSSDIKNVEDFRGKKIMINGSATYTASFVSMLRSHGIEMSDVSTMEHTFSVDTLINKECDIMTAYRTNELYALEKKGVPYRVWDPKNFGFDFYDDLLFTSKRELQNHPDRVAAFSAATLRGFEYAFAHKEETIELILKKYNTLKKSKEALRYEADVLQELAYANAKPLGDIDGLKIQRIYDIYNIFGHIKERVDFHEFIFKPHSELFLSDKERVYLAQKKSINLCVNPDWMPFESIEDGKHIGMSAEYLRLLESKLPIPFKLVQTQSWEESLAFLEDKKCDMLSLVMPTSAREHLLRFTDSYLKVPVVMATQLKAPYMSDFSMLKHKKIAIVKGYEFLKFLRSEYPNFEIVEVKNIHEGLQKVVDGEVYGYVDTLPTIGYAFQKEFTGELKIAGKFDGSRDFGIGVHRDEPLLYEILQKGVRSIDASTREQLLNNWLSITYENGIDYKIIFKIALVFGFILSMMLFFYLREKRLKRQVQQQKALLEAIINTIPNPLFYKSREGYFENVNDSFARTILGLQREEVLGKELHDLRGIIAFEIIDFHLEQDRALYEDHNSLEYDSRVELFDGTLRDYKISKTVFRSLSGECLGYIGIMTDITQHKENEKRLELLASIDPLTQLYNRRHFTSMAKHLFNLAMRHQEALSVVMLDIDNFKQINDTYGHKVGDDVIVSIATILQKLSRESDIVARFGGEEYILLLPKTSREGAMIIAEKLRVAVENSSVVLESGEKIYCSVSLGVSEVSITHENDIEAAIKRADDALYRSKNSGKNRVTLA